MGDTVAAMIVTIIFDTAYETANQSDMMWGEWCFADEFAAI